MSVESCSNVANDRTILTINNLPLYYYCSMLQRLLQNPENATNRLSLLQFATMMLQYCRGVNPLKISDAHFATLATSFFLVSKKRLRGLQGQEKGRTPLDAHPSNDSRLKMKYKIIRMASSQCSQMYQCLRRNPSPVALPLSGHCCRQHCPQALCSFQE